MLVDAFALEPFEAPETLSSSMSLDAGKKLTESIQYPHFDEDLRCYKQTPLGSLLADRIFALCGDGDHID